MSRFVQLLRSHFARPGAAAVFAVFICGFAPLVLLLTLSPDRISLWASYAIAAICASLATLLLRTPAQSWAWDILGAKNQAHDLDAANENELGGGALQGPGALASILSKELTAGRGPSLLGVIRIANYDRMAAFDVAMADRFIAAFHQRLETALGKTRHLAWVERNCFAIWFGHHATVSGAQAELKALSYALTQSISDDRFTIEPELEIGSAETGRHRIPRKNCSAALSRHFPRQCQAATLPKVLRRCPLICAAASRSSKT